jgi:DNA repair protein RecN (Recombination protein N)
MLKSLYIKDYALIEILNIEFQNGLNIITGETGAGKSILIDAMGLLLGERASNEVIRKGAAKSIVEGIFDISKNKNIAAILEENEIDFNDELIMRRELSVKGSNRCFINDTPVSLNLIKEAGNLLVDLHGQHEHQSLLKSETHIDFLDDFSQCDDLLNSYKHEISLLQKVKKELKDLKEREALLKEKKELYTFQIKEIDSISPRELEDEELTNELRILENSEKLMDLTSSVYNLIYEDDNSIYDSIAKVQTEINQLAEIDKAFNEILNETSSAISLIDDIKSFVRNYKSKIDVDPQRLDEMRGRLAAINLLKKKFGGSILTLLDYRKRIGDEVNLAESFEEKTVELKSELNKQLEICGAAASKLTQTRINSAKVISEEVVSELSSLGINDARFEVSIKQNKVDNGNDNYILVNNTPLKYDSNGVDVVEFFISTNIGEDLKPLAKVASGGEVSRVMLALKSTLAKNDKLPLLIFDEIDTGVSGRIAQKVGLALKSLAKFHQIIAITHLPQIAGMGDSHFAVEKGEVENRVVSSIRQLNEDERVREIAKLMSGEEITDSSINGARELMGLLK